MTSRENARCQSDQIDIVVAHLLRQVHAAETYIIFFIVVWILYASYRFSLWKNNPSGKQVRALLSDLYLPCQIEGKMFSSVATAMVTVFMTKPTEPIHF